MEILVDARGLLESCQAGVEGYTYKMLINLQRMYPEDEYILFSYSRNRSLIGDLKEKFVCRHFRWSNLLMSLQWRILKYPKIDNLVDEVDVVWFPNIRFMPVSKKITKITTVHDLSFEIMPEQYSFKRRLWHWHMNIRQNLMKMDGVVAVSKKTGEDLRKIYGIDKNIIKVINSGVERQSIDKIGNNPVVEGNYLVHVGTLEPRKNAIGLLDAFSLLIKDKQFTGLKLIFIGGEGESASKMNNYLKKNNLDKKVIITGYLADQQRDEIISGAKMLVYNSFYEGFGFPPLEAMSMGVPVVSSFAGSLGEILGESCLIIDPLDTASCARTIKKLLLEKNSYQKYFYPKINQILDKYSWQNTAREFRDYIISCCRSKENKMI